MHRFGHRALAGVAASLVAGCGASYIGEIPPVALIRVTAQRATLRVGESTTVVGEVWDARGGVINHRRRMVQFVARDTNVVTVVGAGSATLTGRAPGSSWIVGESGGKRDSVQVTVTP